MSAEELAFDSASFSGRARLFPLPNLVMFPHVLQPLHIFEPRYREMLEDAMADDRLIAMSILAPGWEKHYEGRPALESVACLGRVVTHQKVENGRYNLLLAGLKRVRIVHELPPTKAYREARVEIIDDVYSDAHASDRPRLQRMMLDRFRKMLPNMPEVHKQLEEMLCTDVSLGMLTDLVAYTLEIPLQAKTLLLNEANVDRRCAALIQLLRDAPKEKTKTKTEATGDSSAKFGGKWPPDFSAN